LADAPGLAASAADEPDPELELEAEVELDEPHAASARLTAASAITGRGRMAQCYATAGYTAGTDVVTRA
jgi:hypothetical protein